MDNQKRPYRSFFWPIVLIGVGVIWLLDNFHLLPSGSLNLLLNLWPIILIVIGIDLLIGRRSGLTGGLIGLLLVGGILFVLLAGPSMGIKINTPSTEFRVEHFTTPLDSAKSATIRIDSSSEPVEIKSISNDLLFDGTIGHTGTMNFEVSGTTDKSITLSKRSTVGFSLDIGNNEERKWKIGLTDKIPLSLDIESSSGSVNMDLRDIQLSNFRMDSGSGSVTMTLPQSSAAYRVDLTSGSGSLNITIPDKTGLTLRTDSGSGSLNMRLPAGAALRVEVLDTGSGSVNLPASLSRIEGSGNRKEGVWETSGYASAQNKILIQLTGIGSGSVNIH